MHSAAIAYKEVGAKWQTRRGAGEQSLKASGTGHLTNVFIQDAREAGRQAESICLEHWKIKGFPRAATAEQTYQAGPART